VPALHREPGLPLGGTDCGRPPRRRRYARSSQERQQPRPGTVPVLRLRSIGSTDHGQHAIPRHGSARQRDQASFHVWRKRTLGDIKPEFDCRRFFPGVLTASARRANKPLHDLAIVEHGRVGDMNHRRLHIETSIAIQVPHTNAQAQSSCVEEAHVSRDTFPQGPRINPPSSTDARSKAWGTTVADVMVR
jgi:hypothetical protein